MYSKDGHPKGKCPGRTCPWCFPSPGRVRVSLDVRLDLDVNAVNREMGINMQPNDAKIWLEEDLSTLISQLPYLPHASQIQIRAKGLRRDGRS